jgi:lipopolysaccharide transport system ATP-binding protein
MTDIAIKADNLSKRYRIGLKDELPDTLVGAVTRAVKQPLRNLRRLRRLTTFGDDGRPTTDDNNPSSSTVPSSKSRPSSAAVRADVDSDTIWALRDISFEVARGEVVGIIGRNGAGKSTLLKVLSRITHPTTGRIEINGRVSSLLEVGTGFHTEMTGRENIYLNGTILGMTKNEVDRKFDEIVAFSGVEKFIDTPVKRYSSGMRVRLAFSVAAHLEPEILLVDEVLAVGDSAFQQKCLGKMGEMTRRGRTVLFVSHNMGAVKSLCSRAILLEQGRLDREGRPAKVIEAYLDACSEAAHQMSQTGIIPDDAPRRGTGEARIRGASLVDANGTEVSRLCYGQPLQVAMTLEIFEPVEDAMLEVSITTIDGTNVVQSFSTDNGREPFSLRCGSCALSWQMDIDLLPRRYSLVLGVYRYSTGKAIDLVERVQSFEVLKMMNDDAGYYRWTIRGFVSPRAKWDVPLNSLDDEPERRFLRSYGEDNT